MSGAAPMEPNFARAARVLGVAAIVSAGFVLTAAQPEFLDLVDVTIPVAVVLVVGGALALFGGIRRSVALSALAGAVFCVAAVAQLAQLALAVTILGGDASSLALFAAWGVGLLCVCWADRNTPTPRLSSPSEPKDA